MTPLKPIEIALIETVKTFTADKGLTPSYAEITDYVGIFSILETKAIVQSLVALGYLAIDITQDNHAITVIAEPGDDVQPISNCHSTLLLDEVFSHADLRAVLPVNLAGRIRKHLARVKLMGQ